MAVRGTFDLNDRPAVDAMRRMRREATETDATFARLGKTVDNTFTTKNVEQGRRYERMLRDVDATARLTLGNVQREWAKTERQTIKSVATSEAAVDRLQVRLDRLGATRVSPEVDLDGVTEAIAQVELLQRRMRSLGRQTARPNVGMPMPTGGGFAGGGGRVPTTHSGGFGGGGVKIPFAGSVPLPLIGGAVAAVPPLLGGATALAGSLGAAALGAGSIGLAGAGVGGAALGLGLPVGISATKQIKESSDALKKYREQVLKTGVDSKAAEQALHAFNLRLQSAPGGTRQFLHSRTALGEEFNNATGPARSSFTRMGTRGLNVGRQLLPTVTPLTNRFFGQAQQQTDQFGDFLAGDRSRGFIKAMGNEAIHTLAPAENISEQGVETFMNLSRAARPFFREGVSFIDHWTEGWAKNSRDIKGVRSDMRGWVDNLKSWGKLIGGTGRLGGDLLSAGTGSGRSMVVDLTKQLDQWDEWVQKNPRQVRSFFRESVDTVEKVAGGIESIGKSLWQIGRLLSPLLGQASELVSVLGSAGLLTPGGLPLLLAGGAGVRAGTRGLGGRIRGGVTGSGGGAPVVVGGVGGAAGAAFGGPAFSRDTYGLARSFGRGRIASTVAGLGVGQVGARGMAAARGFGGRFLPFMALSAGLSAATTQGDLEERVQAGVSGATLGLFRPPKSGSEKEDIGLRHAGMVSAFQAKRFGGDPAGLRRQLLGLGRKINTLGIPTHAEGLMGFLTEDITGGGGATEISDSARIEAEALANRRKRIAGHDLPAAELGDITGAYGVKARHGDPRKAAEESAKGIERRIHKLRGNTAKEFGQMSLGWVRELSVSDPKLRGTYNRMSDSIENRLRKMGQNVAIIHGHIVDVSRKSWDQVADNIDTATQRALSSANSNLTALEKRAETILRRMGYSQKDARGLVYEAQTGHPSKAKSEEAARAHRFGMAAPPTTSNIGPQGNHAGGGRLPHQANGSMQDDIYLGNNQWGASGELMVNRHTERRVDRVLRLAGTSLGREVGREERPHSKPIRETNAFLGARLGGQRFATGGIRPAASLAERMNMGVSGGPGFGGIPSSGHVGGSLHYQGLAYDVTGSAAQMRRYFLTAARTFRGSINELFYDPMGYYYDEGHKVPGAIGGHSDHVHIGFFPSGARAVRGLGRNGGGMGRGRGGGANIQLQAPHSGLGGIPGAAADISGQMMAAGMSNRLNRLVGGGMGGGAGGAIGGGLNSWLTRALRLTHHYSPQNLRLLRGRAMQESGGNPKAVNDWDSNAAAGHPSEGLLQTIPETFSAYKLPGHNNILNPIDNAAAAIRYMYDRYGHVVGPGSGGYATGGRSRKGFAGWYRDGGRGRVNGPTLIGLGENGPEDFEITPTPKRRRGGHRGGGGSGHRISVEVKMGGVTMHGSHDARRVGKEVGAVAAAEIAKALEDSDGVGDEELVG